MLLKEEDLNKILKYIKDYLGENIEEDILKINDDLSLKISKTFRQKIKCIFNNNLDNYINKLKQETMKMDAKNYMYTMKNEFKRNSYDDIVDLNLWRYNKMYKKINGSKGLNIFDIAIIVADSKNDYSKVCFYIFLQEGLINKNKQARDIYESISDPVKREEAMTDYANKLGAKIDEQDEIIENEAIPYGETFGSTDEIDFNIDSYL